MQLEVGSIIEGKVTGITKFGAFVDLGNGKSGMVHISEVADVFVNEITEFLSEGQDVKVKIINIGDDGKISLSIKKAAPKPPAPPRAPRPMMKDKDEGPAPRPVSRPRPAKQPQAPVFTGDPNIDWTPVKSGNAAFEDMLQKFKQTSEEKTSGMKKGQSGRRSNSRKK
ncbi:MAG: S1 RNA-binding domain-containing protein [Clostridia bacterium]|nr:S1 RNA-binding domain-containing protein [Clostridia bacterium]